MRNRNEGFGPAEVAVSLRFSVVICVSHGN